MAASMNECIFCRIVADPSGSHILWDEEDVLAFMDINPVTDGHILVIPKAHTVGLTDLPTATAARMMEVAQILGRALKESDLRCEGINLFFAEGEAAFQEVFHSHLHIFPRYPGDGFTIDAPWEGRNQESLAASADMIRDALPPVKR